MYDLSALAVALAATLAVAVAVLMIFFVVGASLNRHRVVDVAWGLAFTAIALTGLWLSAGHGDPGRRWLLAALVTVWGVRLSGHILLRGWGKPEDPRYAAMLSRAPGSRHAYALRMVYLLQAVSAWFISLPVQVGQYDPGPLTGWAALGVAVWLVGFFFETVGDFQLARFTGNPANRGKVLDTGLWRYTRHPNYFGDACVWWGLFLVAVLSGAGINWLALATIVSPLLMTYLLTKKTGKPLLEAQLATSRPGYADYVARTSGFIPKRPKKD